MSESEVNVRDVVIDGWHHKEITMPWTTDCGECWRDIKEGDPAWVEVLNMDRFRPLHPTCLLTVASIGHQRGCNHENEYDETRKRNMLFGDTQKIREYRERLKVALNG